MNTRRKPGPKPKLTLAIVEEIGRRIARGLTEEQAALSMEPPVNHHALRSARRRIPAIEAAIKKAQAGFLAAQTARILDGAKGWQGAAWILERRHKPQFARTEVNMRNTLSATVERPYVVNMPDGKQAALTLEEYNRVIQRARELANARYGAKDTNDGPRRSVSNGGNAGVENPL